MVRETFPEFKLSNSQLLFYQKFGRLVYLFRAQYELSFILKFEQFEDKVMIIIDENQDEETKGQPGEDKLFLVKKCYQMFFLWTP